MHAPNPTSNAIPQAMRCPKCAADMVTYERSGIHVDQCRECRGIFLDRGELERLVDAESSGAGWTGPQMRVPDPYPLPRDPGSDPRREFDPRRDADPRRDSGYRQQDWRRDDDDDDDRRYRGGDWDDRRRGDGGKPPRRRGILGELLEGLGD